ncbi:MAG: hypothetical protein FPO08_16480 [Geobacter sp.]|nr:MAG: hypothetical protein FPO08_16480 [Geobacter sp.]
MTNELRDERLRELAESNYVMLKQTYCSMRQLKDLVDRLHERYLEQGTTFEMDAVSALKLTADGAFEELERYLRPECDPDSADDKARAE